MKTIFAIGLLYVLIQGAFCAKKLNVTFTSWEGTNCASYTPMPTGCTTDKLTPYSNAVLNFKEGDTLCVNLPNDPKNLFWKHSAASLEADKNLPWDQRLEKFCVNNSTGNYFVASVYQGLGCDPAKTFMNGTTPIGNIMAMYQTPMGNFNYTEIVHCVVYDGASHIATNLLLVLAIIFFLF